MVIHFRLRAIADIAQRKIIRCRHFMAPHNEIAVIRSQNLIDGPEGRRDLAAQRIGMDNADRLDRMRFAQAIQRHRNRFGRCPSVEDTPNRIS